MVKRFSTALLATLLCSTTRAGVIVTLVPTPAMPPEGYTPGQLVHVNVMAQLDMAILAPTPGAPGARLRSAQFDISDSSPELHITPVTTHTGADINPDGTISFWDFNSTSVCSGDAAACGDLYFIDGDVTSNDILNITYTGLTTSGSRQITLLASGRKIIGQLEVIMPDLNGTFVLDVLNADEVDHNQGAEFRHGFGVTNDPSVLFRANIGTVSGGQLTFVVGGAGPDCNQNGISDQEEDCNANKIPDSCETRCADTLCGCLGQYLGEYEGPSTGTVESTLDCQGNLTFKFISSAGPVLFQSSAAVAPTGPITGLGQKIQIHGQFDFETCSGSGSWSIAGGEQSAWSIAHLRECLSDCNENLVPDSCEIRDAQSPDCNDNAIPDECDLDSGFSFDCNHNDTPDECEDPPVFAITFTDPVDGTVDVRQDRSITGQTAQGFDRVRMRFTCEPYDAATGEPFTTDSFEVSSTSGIAPLVFIIMEAGEPNTYDIILSDPIPPGAWTTISAIVESPDGVPIDPTANSVTLGFLPGDVNGNGRTTPSDILELIDNLNGLLVPPLPPRQCDLDRSSQCVPSDIVRLIDLLNGVNTSRPWLNVSLPPAP